MTQSWHYFCVVYAELVAAIVIAHVSELGKRVAFIETFIHALFWLWLIQFHFTCAIFIKKSCRFYTYFNTIYLPKFVLFDILRVSLTIIFFQGKHRSGLIEHIHSFVIFGIHFWEDMFVVIFFIFLCFESCIGLSYFMFYVLESFERRIAIQWCVLAFYFIWGVCTCLALIVQRL